MLHGSVGFSTCQSLVNTRRSMIHCSVHQLGRPAYAGGGIGATISRAMKARVAYLKCIVKRFAVCTAAEYEIASCRVVSHLLEWLMSVTV